MAPPLRAREYRLARARLLGRSQRFFFAARAFSRARFPAGFSFSAGWAGRLPVYSHAEAMFSISGKPRPLVFSCTYIPPFEDYSYPGALPRCAQKNALRHDFLTDSG